MKQQTIAVDIDDVLSRSAEGFVAFSNERWGTELKPEDYREEWAVVWGVPLETALQRASELVAAGIEGGLEPHQPAMPVLGRLATKFNLVVVTSRRATSRPLTEGWLAHHFPNIFHEVHFVGAYDNSAADSVAQALAYTKGELCREIGANYLVDDQLKHCIGAAEAGIPSVLFGEYQWNRSETPLPSDVTRVRDWDGVAEYFGV